MRREIENAGDDEGMQEIEAVAGVAKKNKPASAEERCPIRLGGKAVNDCGEGGRKNSGGENGIGNFWGKENNHGKTQQTGEEERRGEFFAGLGASEENAASKHPDEKFGQADERIEAKNIFPEEIRFTGIDFVWMKMNIAEGKQKADQPERDQADDESFRREFSAAQKKKWKNEIEKSFDGKAPADGIPGERGLWDPGLQQR